MYLITFHHHHNNNNNCWFRSKNGSVVRLSMWNNFSTNEKRQHAQMILEGISAVLNLVIRQTCLSLSHNFLKFSKCFRWWKHLEQHELSNIFALRISILIWFSGKIESLFSLSKGEIIGGDAAVLVKTKQIDFEKLIFITQSVTAKGSHCFYNRRSLQKAPCEVMEVRVNLFVSAPGRPVLASRRKHGDGAGLPQTCGLWVPRSDRKHQCCTGSTSHQEQARDCILL